MLRVGRALLRFVTAGSEDGDSLFALANESVHLAPCVKAGHARCRWALQSTHTLRMFC